MRVLDDVRVGQHDQTLLHHLVKNRHKGFQFFFRINHGQQDRPIMGKAQRGVLVNSPIGPITENSRGKP